MAAGEHEASASWDGARDQVRQCGPPVNLGNLLRGDGGITVGPLQIEEEPR